MSVNSRVVVQKVTALNASAVAGTPIFVGGARVSVGIEGPGAFGRVEISQDKANWEVGVDVESADITTITTGVRELQDRVQWVRPATVTGAGNLTVYSFVFTIFREDQ